MNSVLPLPKLSCIQVNKYHHKSGAFYDFIDLPRPHYSLGLLLSGNGEFRARNRIVHAYPGDLMFLPINSTHTTKWANDSDASFISVHFNFEYPNPFLYTSKLNIQTITPSNFDRTLMLYNKLLEEYTGGIKNHFRFISLFYEIMGEVYPQLNYEGTNPIDERITKAADYIQQHYTEEFSNEDLAKLCNMSISRLYSLFKQALNMSPIEYKNSLLINRAKVMLLDDSNMSIQTISDNLGFNSTDYFRRLFKKYTGITPREFHKKERYINSRNGL